MGKGSEEDPELAGIIPLGIGCKRTAQNRQTCMESTGGAYRRT